MGLVLLIPGLVLTHNGTTWFDGENAVGHILNGVGGGLLVLQLLIIIIGAFAFVARH